jgi:hypothetical protein
MHITWKVAPCTSSHHLAGLAQPTSRWVFLHPLQVKTERSSRAKVPPEKTPEKPEAWIWPGGGWMEPQLGSEIGDCKL